MKQVLNTRPDPQFLAGWRNHIAETGEPETFDGVSNDRADRHVPVILLSEEIKVPLAKRPGGERVPCPLCSPTAPKFSNGRMAFFPQDGRVRFIGCNCARKHLGTHYAEAEKQFRLEQEHETMMAMLPRLQAIQGQLMSIIIRIYASARRVEALRTSIVFTGRGFAAFLLKDIIYKDGVISMGKEEQSYRVAGLTMLQPDFAPKEAAEAALDVIGGISTALSDPDVVKRSRKIRKVLLGLPKLRADIEDAAKFPSTANIRLLQRWTASGNAPFSEFTIKQDGDRVTIDAVSFDGRFCPHWREDRDAIVNLPTLDELNALGITEIIE